jgi:hypothetical protein
MSESDKNRIVQGLMRGSIVALIAAVLVLAFVGLDFARCAPGGTGGFVWGFFLLSYGWFVFVGIGLVAAAFTFLLRDPRSVPRLRPWLLALAGSLVVFVACYAVANARILPVQPCELS